ncbi:MAG: dephospho-CoA kinase [Pseudomonadales bacterium]
MKIGLTGGIASGKSTVARHLAALGAHVIDADKLGHRAYEPDTEAFRAVVTAFGDDVVDGDGRIDRKALGAKVFGRPERLKQLTDIVWPEIGRLAAADIGAARERDPDVIIVLEAAVLFEAGWQRTVDEVWAVIVEPEVAVARACARDGLSPEDVRRRIDAQIGNDERRARADVVIDNSGDLDSLLAQVEAEWARVRAGAAGSTA